jgi:hypothetical protein
MRLLESTTNLMLFIYSFGLTMILHIVVRKLKPLDNSSSAISDYLTVSNNNISIHSFQTSPLMSHYAINLF